MHENENRHLTDKELQALAMIRWLVSRSWGVRPPTDLPEMAYLIHMGLVVETYLDDLLVWDIRITDYGNQLFEQLSTITRIHTFIRCSLESDAIDLMKQSLSYNQLPEFIAHPVKEIREAAVGILEGHRD